MRPTRLTIQAFGPYRELEIVDFTELGANRVFLIHGDTGAGKTTILDAMVFALYGDTSGGERRADQMRCESAAESLATEVTLDFSLGAKKFRVRRRPAQELLGARGGKVSKPAEAALWDRSSCGDEAEGRLLTTKIGEVNARIKDTLGFSCEQFRQVVVLPQGRFRELLSAGSDKREEILRQLFRTDRFRELEDALAERAKVIRGQVQELKAQRAAQLGLVDAVDEAELQALIEAAGALVNTAAAAATHAAARATDAAEALSAAERADEARKAQAAARADLQRLEERKEEAAARRSRVEAAARAEKVRSAAERLAEARRRAAAATTARADLGDTLTGARAAEREAQALLEAEDQRAPEREALADNVRRLEALTGAIVAWDEAKTAREVALRAAAAAQEATGAAVEARTRADERVILLQERVAAAKAATTELEGAHVRLETARQHEDRCRRLLTARDLLEAAEERHMRLVAAEVDALDALSMAESELAGAEERWRTGRAAALAARLLPGAPCPVCGATDHPAPAATGEADVSDDYLAAASSAVDFARRAHRGAREAAARAANELTAADTAEKAIHQEPGARSELAPADAGEAVAVCVAEIERLSAEAGSGEAQEQLIAANEQSAAARAAAENATDTLVDADKALAVANTQMNERAAAVPEDLRVAGALQAAIDKARRVKSELDAAFAAAQKRHSEAREMLAKAESAVDAATAAHTEAVAQEESCSTGFRAALAEQAFPSEDEWRQALLTHEERSELESALEAYSDALSQAKGRLQQAELSLADQLESRDLSGLRSAADEARAMQSTALEQEAAAKGAAATLAKVRQSLAEIDGRSQDIRHRYDTVGVLAEVANGFNTNRVSFQRWVLGVYLDEVLLNASQKLFGMSKGRYRLERHKEAAGRGRASGLDLAVFDEFSGSSRPAVTLSGGESFLAALSLALGLAETVQEHAAGIPLETIFVDEGFGALDSDALELAIDALMELQLGGRLVGVISHVPELRQVIPARLEVRGGSTGSSTRFSSCDNRSDGEAGAPGGR